MLVEDVELVTMVALEQNNTPQDFRVTVLEEELADTAIIQVAGPIAHIEQTKES
jgi:hypothetical protein